MYEYIVYTVQSPPKLFTLLAPKKKDGDRTHRSKGKGRRVCLGKVCFSIPCHASYLPRSIWKNRMSSTFSSKSTEAKQLKLQGIEKIMSPK